LSTLVFGKTVISNSYEDSIQIIMIKEKSTSKRGAFNYSKKELQPTGDDLTGHLPN